MNELPYFIFESKEFKRFYIPAKTEPEAVQIYQRMQKNKRIIFNLGEGAISAITFLSAYKTILDEIDNILDNYINLPYWQKRLEYIWPLQLTYRNRPDSATSVRQILKSDMFPRKGLASWLFRKTKLNPDNVQRIYLQQVWEENDNPSIEAYILDPECPVDYKDIRQITTDEIKYWKSKGYSISIRDKYTDRIKSIQIAISFGRKFKHSEITAYWESRGCTVKKIKRSLQVINTFGEVVATYGLRRILIEMDRFWEFIKNAEQSFCQI